MNAPPSPVRFFVYGTLRRGECRERCWPCAPIRIDEAIVRAELYDLGPYPAISPGDDVVRGELWEFAPSDLPDVFRAIDAVEGFAGSDHDLYVRRVITCRRDDGEEFDAWTYYYADTLALLRAVRVLPGEQGECEWNGERR